MSKIGNKIILIQENISVKLISNDCIVVNGPKGRLSLYYKFVSISVNHLDILVKPLSNYAQYKKYQGLYRSLINNMIIGVSKGFIKKLILQGVGFKANIKDNVILLSVGFSHIVNITIPNNINIEISNQSQHIHISGIDKQLVGAFAAKIRDIYPPNAYLNKGIKYADESVVKKQGKTNIK